MRRFPALVLVSSILASCVPAVPPGTGSGSTASGVIGAASSAGAAGVPLQSGNFGADVPYEPAQDAIAPTVRADFSLNEVTQLAAFEKAYGFTLTPGEKQFLQQNKFVLKTLTETTIRPKLGEGPLGDRYREFAGLYNAVSGSDDYKTRGPQNAVFYGPDAFLNLYNTIYTELLKEMENESFYPSMAALSKAFYEAAAAKAAAAPAAEKAKWTKVREYFAVPHAILSTVSLPPTMEDYMKAEGKSPDEVMQAYRDSDAAVDTAQAVTVFVKKLNLGPSEAAVLADVQSIYKAEGRGVLAVFKSEYEAYASQEGVRFQVDFTQFTPRSHYTSSSLRRQYFRAMSWYIHVPFFLKSAALTEDAYAIAQLLAEHPEQLRAYGTLESAINFLVGGSDDLMPVDYIAALEAAKGAADPQAAVMGYLVAARQPKIKAIPAEYPGVGTVQTADVLLKTKGMRFFSGKFILDSYWTGQLTQGDEAPKPGYTQKLPPMASSLQVMALLGSDYARTQITKLDFYTPQTSQAIDKAMADLTKEAATLTDADWKENIYMTSLWTIKALFDWPKAHREELPAFMRSPFWEIKTLQTASAFWTEMRHATLLYAKQSFAELGGGGPGKCDTRQVPEPPKGYIEPQPEAYARLAYMARRTRAGLEAQGFGDLRNMYALQAFTSLMDTVRGYAARELADAKMQETVVQRTGPDENDPKKTCTVNEIEGQSDWETIRLLVRAIDQALPVPVEGPILPAKDKRNALLADVHTGGDIAHPTEVLYQGTGVPRVALVAVKDANGPRLTIGFVSSHYEFRQPYGGKRLTDEDWQKRFYTGDEPYSPYQYTDAKTWPAPNPWYMPLYNLK